VEVADTWHELVVPRRIMQPSIARDSGQLDVRRSRTDIPPPQSGALGLHPVARRLLLINRLRIDGTLSWRWYIAVVIGIRTHDLAIASPAPYYRATVHRQLDNVSSVSGSAVSRLLQKGVVC